MLLFTREKPKVGDFRLHNFNQSWADAFCLGSFFLKILLLLEIVKKNDKFRNEQKRTTKHENFKNDKICLISLQRLTAYGLNLRRPNFLS